MIFSCCTHGLVLYYTLTLHIGIAKCTEWVHTHDKSSTFAMAPNKHFERVSYERTVWHSSYKVYRMSESEHKYINKA